MISTYGNGRGTMSGEGALLEFRASIRVHGKKRQQKLSYFTVTNLYPGEAHEHCYTTIYLPHYRLQSICFITLQKKKGLQGRIIIFILQTKKPPRLREVRHCNQGRTAHKDMWLCLDLRPKSPSILTTLPHFGGVQLKFAE